MATSRLLRLTGLTIAALVSLQAADRASNQVFEGKWSLDKNASGSGVPGHLVEEIKTNGSELQINSKYDQPQNGIYPLAWLGIMAEKINLGLDGNEVMNQFGPYRHVSKTTISGNTMTTTWTATDPPGTVEGTWIRTVADDGRTMTLQVKGKASDGRTFDSTVHLRRK